MYCQTLAWKNFRNLGSGRIQLPPAMLLLAGNNGAGKTNLLEIFHFLGGWGPLPGRKVCDAPSWGQTERAFLSARFQGEEDVECAASLGRTTVLALGKTRCRAPDLRVRVPSLLFLPDDLHLVEGSPSVRRRFVDRLAALLFPLYAQRLHEYGRALRHRAILLRQGRSPSVTGRVLAPLGGWIWSFRAHTVVLLVRHLALLRSLLPGSLSLVLHRGSAGAGDDPLEAFLDGLKISEEEERRTGFPVVGPHRDDLLLDVDGVPAARKLSRGQRRRLAVALVVAAGYAVREHLRRTPVLLLDEVAAELDFQGRALLFDTLRSTSWQVVATTAEKHFDDWPGEIVRVSGGKLWRNSEEQNAPGEEGAEER